MRLVEIEIKTTFGRERERESVRTDKQRKQNEVRIIIKFIVMLLSDIIYSIS